MIINCKNSEINYKYTYLTVSYYSGCSKDKNLHIRINSDTLTMIMCGSLYIGRYAYIVWIQ